MDNEKQTDLDNDDPVTAIHEWLNMYQRPFRLSDQRLTLSGDFGIYPKQGYVRLKLDELPLLEMTSAEARAWAAEIIQTADRADEEAARYEAEQAQSPFPWVCPSCGHAA
jgi:hypothetical protein